MYLIFHTPASSTRARPIKRLAHPSTIALEILPQQYISTPASHGKRSPLPPPSTKLRYTDSFRLTISAFDQGAFMFCNPNHLQVLTSSANRILSPFAPKPSSHPSLGAHKLFSRWS